MRRAMAEAEVGDDVWGEDPTVARLESEAAATLGLEAALFVPSGTMGNQIALHLHTRPGREVICEATAHIYEFEMGAMAALSGIVPRLLPTADGLITPVQVAAAFRPAAGFATPTALLAVENTHNVAGGIVYDRQRLDELIAAGRKLGLPVHLDGARIFNAAVALGTPAAELARGFDSVMFCLSKGLGAPVGSLLCGNRDFIAAARNVRKMFGGGMRQSGVLAAAGLLALRDGPGRLAADHARARRLAEAVAALPGVEIDLARVRTNILVFRVGRATGGSLDEPVGPARSFLDRLAKHGILGSQFGAEKVRLVTHRDVSDQDVDRAVEALASFGSPAEAPREAVASS
ncbi:MAG TPA: GntG family PLP-dependent aldolase, partial [Thermoanaerobaculia bacterium]|nr:GntG family PLP-dependent aldolase [Thermoanaerobaculia bacterium]